MIMKRFDFLEVRLSAKLFVNFHSVAVKDKSCTIRHVAAFEFPAQTSNKTRLNVETRLKPQPHTIAELFASTKMAPFRRQRTLTDLINCESVQKIFINFETCNAIINHLCFKNYF